MDITEARMLEICQISDQANINDQLRSFISHGDALTSSIINGIEEFGFYPFTRLLDYGLKLSSFFPLYALTWISIVLLVLFLYLFVVFLASLPSLGSLKYANRIQILYNFKWHREKKVYASRELNTFDNTVYARRFKVITIFFVLGMVIAILAEILGGVYSVVLLNESYKFRCQLSRVSHELLNGLQYSPLSRESVWLQPVVVGTSYHGLKTLTNSKENFGNFKTESETYYTELQNYTLYFAETLWNLRNSLNEVVKITNRGSSNYGCIGEMNIAQNSEIKDLIFNLTEGNRSVEYLRDTVQPLRSEFNDTYDNWDSLVGTVTSLFNDANSYINNYFNFGADPLKTIAIIFICLVFLPLPALIIVFIVYFLLARDYYTRVNPIASVYSKIFCGLWIWFAVLSLICIIATTFLLNATSYVAGGCSWLHEAPYKQSYITDYSLTANFMDKNAIQKAALDVCFFETSNIPDSSVFRLMGNSVVDYEKSISKLTHDVRNTMAINRILTPEQHTVIQNTIGMVTEPQPIVIINFLNKQTFTSPNHQLVPDEFLLATGEGIKNLPKNFVFDTEVTREFQKREEALANIQNLINENSNGLKKECIRNTPLNLLKITSVDDVLKRLEIALYECVNPNPYATEEVPNPLSFSITLNNVPYYGNRSLNRPMVYEIIEGSIISDIANIAGGSYEGFQAEPVLQEQLNKCINNVKSGVTCELYHLNTLYVGMRLLIKRKMESWSCNVNLSEARRARNYATVLSTAQIDFEYRPSAINGVTGERLFHRQLEPTASINMDAHNCKALLSSVAVMSDGLCEGYFHPLFWIFISFVFLTFLLIIASFVCFLTYLHFKRNIPVLKKLVTPARDVGDPKMWLDLVKEYDHDREVLYKLMDESPMESGEIRDEMDSDMLHFAAFSGDIETVFYLLKKGVDVDRKNARGYTPLSIAVSEGHAAIVSMLIEHGADPTIQDEFGDTPLHAATRSGDIECVKAICQPIAPPPTYKNNEKEYAVETARKQGHSYIMSFLGPLTPRA